MARRHIALLAAVCFSTITPIYAAASDGSTNSTTEQTVKASPDLSDNAAHPTEGKLSRWVEMDALSFTMRYRNTFDTNGVRLFDNIQQRSLVSGKFKFDKEGKYFVGFRASSGKYFNWSFSNFSGLDYGTAVLGASPSASIPHQIAVGTAYAADPQAGEIISKLSARGWQFYMRDLYMSATPVSWLTLQFGAIPIERGVGTEITTYDEDGYISGERVIVHAPEHVYLDKIAFTSAYLGDVFTPNFFERYNRFGESNYRQVLAEKKFGSRLKASMDYTWLIGTHTMREALQAKTGESRILDSARIELYQRTNDHQLPGYLAMAGNGWGFTGTKQFSKKLTFEGGFASVDGDAGVYSGSPTLAAVGFALNGDSYQVGQRFFGRANVKVVPGISLFGFYTHAINSKETPLTYTFTRQNMNFGMQFDFKTMLQKAHIL